MVDASDRGEGEGERSRSGDDRGEGERLITVATVEQDEQNEGVGEAERGRGETSGLETGCETGESTKTRDRIDARTTEVKKESAPRLHPFSCFFWLLPFAFPRQYHFHGGVFRFRGKFVWSYVYITIIVVVGKINDRYRPKRWMPRSSTW